MSWLDIGDLNDIPLRGARVIKTKVGCVALFRTAPDEVFATSDRCPHKGGPLSEGIVHGHQVTCPLHDWVFDLTTGAARGADQGAVRTWPVRVERGRILISAESLMRGKAA